VQTVLADVTGGGLAGLASDLGVEAEELEAIVKDPDFEREVREELARITAG
jgi:predicted DsbA family dithiol-disulfide isomerase